MNARLQMILSMALFGTLPWFVSNIPLASPQIALIRAAIALACLLALQAARKRPPRLRGLGRELPLLFLSGAAMGFNWILLFEAYRYTTASVATLSYYFAPVIVTVVSPVLFRERLTRRQLVCFAGATAGLVLVIRPGGLPEGGQHFKGIAFGLGAAALYAGVILMNKSIRRVSGMDRTLLQFAAATLVLLPYALLTGGAPLKDLPPLGWLCLLAVGALHSCAGYVMYFSALRDLPGQEVAVLSYIDPLVAVVVSVTLLREPLAPVQAVGGAVLLAFTLANEMKR